MAAEEKKKEILKWLKRFGKSSITKISGVMGLNIIYTRKYLGELEREGKVKKIEEEIATYYVLK